MIKRLITIVLLIGLTFIKAQDNNFVEQIKITTFFRNMESKKEQSNFLIYSIGKEYLVITKLDTSYNFYWYKEFMDFTNQMKTYNLVRKQVYVKDKLLNKIFRYNCSDDNYINNNEGSSNMYFGLYSNNIKKCEFITPYLYYINNNNNNNNKMRHRLPIKKIYTKHLTELLLNTY